MVDEEQDEEEDQAQKNKKQKQQKKAAARQDNEENKQNEIEELINQKQNEFMNRQNNQDLEEVDKDPKNQYAKLNNKEMIDEGEWTKELFDEPHSSAEIKENLMTLLNEWKQNSMDNQNAFEVSF